MSEVPIDFDDSAVLGWLDAPMNFTARADPISPDFRPERRVAVCMLIVDKSRAGKASWKAMHVLSWALQSPKRVEMLTNLKNGTNLLDMPVVRFEPALDRALDLGLGLGSLRATASARSNSQTRAGKRSPRCGKRESSNGKWRLSRP